MRSVDGDRLVQGKDNAAPDHEPPTLQLMREWIACLKSIEKDQLATPITAPMWCARRLFGFVSREALDRQDRRLWSAICRRYSTVFSEHMLFAGVPQANAPEFVARILSNAFAALRAPPEFHWIPTVLWKQASQALGDQPMLKPKFFLRSLVDEIPDPAARDAVRRVAYGIGKRPAGSARVRREVFEAGCVALHKMLSSNASSLGDWTDGSVSAKRVYHHASDPVPYLELLLLPRAVPPTKAVQP